MRGMVIEMTEVSVERQMDISLLRRGLCSCGM